MTGKIFLHAPVFYFILLACGCITFADGADKGVKNNGCIKEYNITRATSPWHGFTSGYEDEEASKKIAALALKGSDYKAIPSLAEYTHDGKILMGRSEKLGRVAVEVAMFSELRRADATGKIPERFLIGICKTTLLKTFTCAEIAEFLVKSQVVNTFWHVESVLCLDAEEDSAESYSAHYKGKHIYFTSCRNEEALDFKITIDKKTGEMFVEAK